MMLSAAWGMVVAALAAGPVLPPPAGDDAGGSAPVVDAGAPSDAGAPREAAPPDGGLDGGPVTLALVVMGFEGNAAAAEHAQGVTAVVASALAEAPGVRVITASDVGQLLGVERQKALLGCAAESCVAELSGAVGARYVLSGRVDRFVKQYQLTATLLDTQRASSLAKPHAEAEDEAALVPAARKIAAEVLDALGRPAVIKVAVGQVEEQAGAVSLGLKLGPKFFTGLRTLNLSISLELGYRFFDDWMALLQVGVTLVSAQQANLAIVPSLLGVRHFYRLGKLFQPYWGLGLGLQLSFGQFGFFTKTGPLPTILGFLGMMFEFRPDFGAGLEASTNLAQGTLAVVGNEQGSGFNFDLNLAVWYRF